MRKTDITQYNTSEFAVETSEERKQVAAETASAVFKTLGKGIFTLFIIFVITGCIVGVSLIPFLMNLKNQKAPDLSSLKLDFSSFIYVKNKDGKNVQYMSLHSSENRVWVDYKDIPEHMKDAMIAIEDKRFNQHKGVDWRTTFGAAAKLFTGQQGGGGSTITQQLIKNITGRNDVSILRKAREISSALNLEKKYSKSEILEAYLNIVNFGSGCNGVQAAANLYFDKDISKCDIAQCAAIAGITQNPYKYNPLIFPENNKKRQQLVLREMYDQNKISKEQFNAAMRESEHMKFVGFKQDGKEEVKQVTSTWNWYIEALVEDVVNDLQQQLHCSKEKAQEMLYHGGLKIYCAMNPEIQKKAERVFANEDNYVTPKAVQTGFYMMGYDGRVLATVGARGEKKGNRVLSYATDTKRQVGSSLKPIGVYSVALQRQMINYSTMLKDEPLPNYFGPGKPGPSNAGRPPEGKMTVAKAIRVSQNTAAVQLANQVGPRNIFDFLTKKLHFAYLDPKTDSTQLSAMAIGGFNGGATVKEMTAAYQMFANGGKYNKPFTYYYVEDHNGSRILDNTRNVPSQVLSEADATIMHKLLCEPVYGPGGTARRAAIYGWDVFGKTGTTDGNRDIWFIGGTPFGVAGVWSGYKTPHDIPNFQTRDPITLWKLVMQQCLKGQNSNKLKFEYDSNVIAKKYCMDTGCLASPSCKHTRTGWYEKGHLPPMCTGDHVQSESSAVESKASSKPAESSSAVSSLPTSSVVSVPAPNSGASKNSSSENSSNSQISHSSKLENSADKSSGKLNKHSENSHKKATD